MKKRNLLTLTALCLSLGLAVTACQGPQGQQGEKGEKGETGAAGKDGETPTIGANGNWFIGGKDTGVSAKGEAGATPEIGENGNWWINGKDTGVSATAKGEKGDAGESGKTYQAIIINNWNVSGGKITQDKYFVQPGETFTLTFEPNEGLDVVLGLEINGEEVEIAPDARELTITSTAADKGWQVTDCKFTTVSNYVFEGTIGYYNDTLAKKDIGLAQVGNDTKTYTTSAYGSYGDAEHVVAKVAIKQYAAVNTAITALGKEATTAEKIAAADIAIASAKSAIDESYASVIKATKEKALEDVTTLVSAHAKDSNVKTYITEEQQETLVSNAEASVEAATTLEDINEVLSTSFPYQTSTIEGSLVTLLAAQKSCLSIINDSLKTAIGSESWLNPGDDTQLQVDQEALVAAIKAKGVAVDQLPSEIAESYAKKVLESEELEEDDETGYVLATEASEELEDSVSGVKKALCNAILNEYYTEVNSLTSISDDSKTALRVKLESAAGTWLKASESRSFKEYLGVSSIDEDGNITYKYTVDTTAKGSTSDTVIDSVNYTKSNLVAILENVLDTVENAQVKNERLTNVLKSYKTAWTNEVKAILASDKTYNNALTYSYVKNSKNLKVLPTSETLGDDSWEIANFVFKSKDGTYSDSESGDFKEITVDNKTTSPATVARDATATASSVNSSLSGCNSYNINTILWNLTDEDSTASESTDNYLTKHADATVSSIKEWGNARSEVFQNSYKAFLEEYAEKVGDSVKGAYTKDYTPSFYESSKLVTSFREKVLDEDNNLLVSNMDEITALGKKSHENIDALRAFDKGLTAYLLGSTKVVKVDETTVKTDGTGIEKTVKGDDPKRVDVDFYNGKLGYDGTVDGTIYTDGQVSASKDSKGYLEESSVSTFYQAVLSTKNEDSILSKVLAGDMDEDAVNNALSTSALDTLYKADTANYVSEVFKVLDKYVENLSNSGSVKPNQVKAMENALEDLAKMCKDGKFVYTGDATDSKNADFTNDAKTFWEATGLFTFSGNAGSYTAVLKAEGKNSVEYSITLANKFHTYAIAYINAASKAADK